MAQREKKSVSLPSGLTRQIQEEAAREGTTFSGWLAETAAHRLKLEAGRRALAEWERENGPITPAERVAAKRSVDALLGRRPSRRRRSA